jgi:hypothetical protein
VEITGELPLGLVREIHVAPLELDALLFQNKERFMTDGTCGYHPGSWWQLKDVGSPQHGPKGLAMLGKAKPLQPQPLKE